MKASGVLVRIVCAAVAAVTVACAGADSAPSGPTSTGAVIRGTVDGAASASSDSAAGLSSNRGIRVTIVGTGLSAVTDSSGQFILTGVPTGTVTLRFEAPGLSADLQLSGLQDGQVLTITVRVNGSRVTLVSSSPSPSPSPSSSPSPSPSPGPSPSPSPDDELEFRGLIESIGSSELRVAGRRVLVTSNTRIERGSRTIPFSSLQVGDLVEVEGVPQGDGSVLARKIKLEDDDDDDEEDEVRLEGRIESIGASELRVSGRRVLVDGNTRIERHGRSIPLSDLRVGERVEVKGLRQADGSVLAERIKLEDDDDDHDDGDDDDEDDDDEDEDDDDDDDDAEGDSKNRPGLI